MVALWVHLQLFFKDVLLLAHEVDEVLFIYASHRIGLEYDEREN